MTNIRELLQMWELSGYNAGKLYQATKQPITNTFTSRIKLPICDEHELDPVWQICKKCGMLAEEIMTNE